LTRLLAGSVFFISTFAFAVLLAGALPAQQEEGKKGKVVEEQDDTKTKKQKRKVPRVDDEEAPRNARKPSATDSSSGDLAALAKGSKHPGIKKLAASLARPHDIVGCEYATSKGRLDNKAVEPLAKHYGQKPQLKRDIPVIPLSQEWQPLPPIRLAPTVIKSFTPYEEIAQEQVAEFLAELVSERWPELPEGSASRLSRREGFAVAYQVLSQVDTWHRAARSKDARLGEEWDEVQKGLEKKLLELREAQLDATLLENDWDAASDLAKDISRHYQEQDVQERIAKRMAKYMVEAASKGGSLTPEQLDELRRRLKQLETQFPGSSAIEVIGDDLKKQAADLFSRGKVLIAAKQNQRGLELLQQALDLYPTLPDLQTTYWRESKVYPTLRVGVKELPVYVAPRVAWTESERNAEEMIFEGLVTQVPIFVGEGNVGEEYEPELADRMPQQTAQLVRRFQISRGAVWAIGPDKTRPVTSADVRGTWQQMRDQNKLYYAPAWADLVDNVMTLDDRHVSIRLQHGFIDPYVALTFKLLPDEAYGQDFKNFARKPFGSGPYRLGEPTTIEGENRLVFPANPYYAARPGKQDMPRIREVYFSTSQNPIDALSKGSIELLLPEAVRDLGREGIEKLRKLGGVKLVGPLPTRRIYFLAINLRKPVFESVELRQALAYAIPRAQILKEVFGDLPGDKPLTGPYPAGSWACDPNVKSLDRPELAKATINQGDARAKLKATSGPLTLKYPRDDKAAEEAMKRIADQLDKQLGVKCELEGLDAHDLRDKVEVSRAFDLAYYHFDFHSEAYWLWPLFHPYGTYFGSRRGEEGYGDADLDSLFRLAMARRDPVELRKQTHLIHNHVNSKMYVIPLWQLGSYYAIRDGIETPSIDPLRVLAEVGQWQKRQR
jgi:ABC-type transport system substrate-binding protein